MNRAFLTIAFAACSWTAYSQDMISHPKIRYNYFQVLYHTGIFWSRTLHLDEQFEEGYRAVEARFGFQSDGRHQWQQLNNYPRYGFGIHYADLVADREDTIVGNPLSAFVFYGAPRVRFGRFCLNTDLSLGLSYASVIHDPVTNPWNDVIASHINLYFDFNVNLSFMLSDRLDLQAGYGVTHYSNGRIHQPQKGVNSWGWNFGLGYHFISSKQKPDPVPPAIVISVRPHFIRTKAPEFSPHEEIQLLYAAGVVENQRLWEATGTHYFTSSFTADYVFSFHPRMAVAFGMDVLYDGSLKTDFEYIPPEEVTTLQKMYFGSHMGYHFFIDRVTILCNFGTYFLQFNDVRGFWFIRAGGRVRLTDKLYTQICIKTKNGIRADWIEWGMGTSLKIR